MDLQKLTVFHFGQTEGENRRITLSPMAIQAVVAEIDDVMTNGRSTRNVTILFSDGGNIEISVNHADLDLLESTIGAYSFE